MRIFRATFAYLACCYKLAQEDIVALQRKDALILWAHNDDTAKGTWYEAAIANIVRPGVVFGKGENGNFTRLYWAIRGHKFAYPGRKDTIKACIYVKELVRFMLYRLEHHEHGVELYNCCFEPAYTIQHIVEAMKKVTGLTQFVPDIPNWVIMPMARMAMLLGSPMGICPARVKKLQISTNICGEKLKNCGYQFKWSFEEALEDWFEDNDRKGLM